MMKGSEDGAEIVRNQGREYPLGKCHPMTGGWERAGSRDGRMHFMSKRFSHRRIRGHPCLALCLCM